jgi:transcriptional regulator with XRE-family HTH domain
VRVKGLREIYSEDFGARLKTFREAKNLTQIQLADVTGSSERGVQAYELNERRPTFDKLIALADALDLSLDELVGRERGER